MSNAPATQSFSWALPTSEKKKAGENEYRKPIVNPLMKKAPDFANGVQSPPHLRYPLASVDNTSLRRRNTSSTKKDVNPVFLPPKLSLTVDGAYMDMPTIDDRETDTQNDTLAIWEESDDDSLERWVLVFGYASHSQFDQIVQRFESFGRVTARRGICRPGTANWVAFQYESIIQAKKALCQQACMLSDGVLVGVTKLDHSKKASLDWTVPTTGNLAVTPKLQVVSNPSKNKTLQEEDILLLEPNGARASVNGKKSVCQRVVDFLFGWS